MRVLTYCVLVLVLACSSSTEPANFAGTYSMSAYAGKPLPIVQGPDTLFADRLIFSADGTFSEFTTWFAQGVKGEIGGAGGTYTVSGNNVRLLPNGAGALKATGVLAGSRLDLVRDSAYGVPALSLTYLKQ